MKPFFIPDLSARTWSVWHRDFDVFKRLFWVNFALPLVEPILYLLAMGFGLGMFIKEINGISYSRFIAPGLISVAAMNAAFFECSFASYVRMYYQRTFEAIVATPVNVEEVVAGEILWGATRAGLSAGLVSLVVAAFGLMPLWLLPITPIIGFAGGLLFGSLGMIATALVPSIDFFNYPISLYITPMFLFSGTFFPITTLPRAVQTVSWIILPLTHLVRINRALLLGNFTWPLLWSFAWIAGVGAIAFYLALRLMHRRLVK